MILVRVESLDVPAPQLEGGVYCKEGAGQGQCDGDLALVGADGGSVPGSAKIHHQARHLCKTVWTIGW